MNKYLIIALLLLCFNAFASAQDTADFGTWNDIRVTKPVNKKVDFIVGFRFDTKNNSRLFSEQRIYSGFNFKQGKFSFQPAIIVLKNFSRAGAYRELRPQLTVGYRTVYNKVGIAPSVRLEYHIKEGGLKNDGRVVPVITFDKKLSKNYGIFNTDEFWIPIGNSRDVGKYRKRFFFGVTRTVNPHLAVDLFYLYQRDERVQPKNNHKIGMTWKIKL
jgi:hypothetical protein